MPPDVAGALVAVLGIVSVGTLVLVGMRMRFSQKLRGREKREQLEQVNEAMDALCEETRVLREEVADLRDRLDFHEGLLTRPVEERVDTPV
jgi:hypothetical protein